MSLGIYLTYLTDYGEMRRHPSDSSFAQAKVSERKTAASNLRFYQPTQPNLRPDVDPEENDIQLQTIKCGAYQKAPTSGTDFSVKYYAILPINILFPNNRNYYYIINIYSNGTRSCK